MRGEEVDSRSDIYSLGIVMFEMLSGGIPFKSKNVLILAHKHVNGKIPKLHFVSSSISASLEKVILKAMAKSPADRYKSCSELMKDWEEALNFQKTVPQEKRHERAVFAAAMFLILAFCTAGTAAFVKFRKTSIVIESGQFKMAAPLAVTAWINEDESGQETGSAEDKRSIEKSQGQLPGFIKDLDFKSVNANEEKAALCKRIAVSEKSPILIKHGSNVTINNLPDKISVPKAKSYFTDFNRLGKNNAAHLPEAALERNKVIAGKISLVNRSAGIVILHIDGAKSGDILQVMRKIYLITYLKVISVYDFDTAVCRVVDNDDIWRLRNGDYAIGKAR